MLNFLEMIPAACETKDHDLFVQPGLPELTEELFVIVDDNNSQDGDKKNTPRKRKRTATDCRVEWREGISFEKAAIIENVDKINEEEMLFREKYGELKGVVRVSGQCQDYKDNDIFEEGRQDLMTAKREVTEVIVKEKQQQAAKVRKIKNTKEDDEAYNIDEVRNQTLAEDIRVSVENSFCSKKYLTKLEAYRKSQHRYIESLQTQIITLDEGITRLCENKENLYQINGCLRPMQEIKRFELVRSMELIQVGVAIE